MATAPMTTFKNRHPVPIERDIVERNMKKLLLGAALVAFASPAWGQVQGDYVQERINQCEGIIVCEWYYEDIERDVFIVAGERLGFSSVSDLTVPATTISSNDIQARNQGVVADLLRTVPGLAVSQNGGAGSLTQIRLRGSEANHITVIVDGVEVANPADGAFDFGGLRTENIVKIEVLRGEQSALYGSDAIGGVVNIITRAGNITESWRVSFEGGSRETFEGQINAIIPLGGAALSINGNAFTTGGFDISGLDGERDGADSRAINLGLNNVELGGLTLSGKYGSTNRNTEFDNDSDFNGRLDNTNDTTEVTTETARIDARFALAGFDHKITVHGTETDTDTVGGFSSRSIGTRQVANWAAKRKFASAHSLTLLGEVELETYQIEPNFTEPDAEPENTTYGIAGDYRFNQDDLTLTVSARHDFNDLFNNATTWRLGAGYGFGWDGRIRASVGTGVKNPTLIELFGFFPASNFTGNPNLSPESSLGVSVGYEQSLGNFNFSVDVFRSELENEITTLFNPDFTTSVVNLETDSTRQGIELTASWSIETFDIQGSASFLDSQQDNIEEIRRPDFLASATATWSPIEALDLTVNVDHNGAQLDTDFATFQNVELDSFTLLGANARFRITDNVALTLRGSNLLDKQYQEVVGFASARRAIFGGLELNF